VRSAGGGRVGILESGTRGVMLIVPVDVDPSSVPFVVSVQFTVELSRLVDSSAVAELFATHSESLVLFFSSPARGAKFLLLQKS
jgi:hypothetical protein